MLSYFNFYYFFCLILNHIFYVKNLHITLFIQGIFSDNKEKLIIMALQALMQREGDQSEIPFHELEAQFQALRRLVASKVGFAALTMLAECVLVRHRN